MALVDKKIRITPEQEAWIESNVSSGEFADESEYVRELIRRDREDRDKLRVLQAAFREGLDRGVSELTLADIWSNAAAQHSARHGGPPD